MQEFRPIIDAFLTKIEEAPIYLPPTIAEERAKEEEEAQVTKETARELRDSKAALQEAEERQDRRIAEMGSELETLRTTCDAEKAELKAKTDEEIDALLVKIEMREKQIEELKAQIEDLKDELDRCEWRCWWLCSRLPAPRSVVTLVFRKICAASLSSRTWRKSSSACSRQRQKAKTLMKTS